MRFRHSLKKTSVTESLVEDYRVESFVSGHGFSRAEQGQLENEVSANARLVAHWLKLELWGGVAARLKPCPDYKPEFATTKTELGCIAT